MSFPRRSRAAAALGVGALLLVSCAGEEADAEADEQPEDQAGEEVEASEPTCQFAPDEQVDHEYARDSLGHFAQEADLKVGNVAAGGGHHEDEEYPDPFPDDEEYREHLAEEFTSLTHENYMKWEFIHPDEWGDFHFEETDAVVEFAQEHGMNMRGHALFWHSQNPEWLEESVEAGEYTQEELRDMLEEHVRTVVSRYAGCIQQWDVVNEVFDDEEEPQLRDGSYEESGNLWIRELGPEILDDVFEWAHEEDPDALLFYNDYAVDGTNAKSDAYYELIQEQSDRGVPVHGFGSQTHLSMQYDFDPEDYQANLQRFEDLGLETAVTEIDVRGELTEEGRMSDEDRAGAAERYGAVLESCLELASCNSYTIWGSLDEHSWIPGTFEGEGDAALYEGDYERKPHYCINQQVLVEHTEGEDVWADDEAFEECRGILEEYGVGV
ncbi:endo-1,4-beta-xylanase [Nesterenkonia cremea]|uniref:Beta-xylanase n=1 Tax=Nesterenkonia cremea TaxID=1882340 RepID=A0A917EN39_9MICC|nr:endo-1,4-beta-xylanase [Nesterenkonia cremea]GGE58666.1 beta-xylanase [Nesterenkonia cremea]